MIANDDTGYLYGWQTAVRIADREAEVHREASQRQRDIDEIYERLCGVGDKTNGARLFGLAASDLGAAVVGELNAEAAGAPGARRLSDPKNAQQRNEQYAELAHQHSLAEGRKGHSKETRIKNAAAQAIK